MRATIPATLAVFALLMGSAHLSCSRAKTDEQLAQLHCGTCHAYPPPEAITVEGWKRVLMFMAVLTGQAERMIADPPEELGETGSVSFQIEDMVLQSEEMGLIIPKQPLLDSGVFRRLVDFYMKSAPDSPIPQSDEKLPIETTGNPFQVSVAIPVALERETFVTLVRIDERSNRVFTGGRRSVKAEDRYYLAVHDLGGAVIREIALESPPVSLEPMGRDFLLATIGDMKMRQASNARLYRLTDSDGDFRTSVLAENLYRAANALPHLEPDGSHLIAFHGFGFQSGSITLFHEKDWEIRSRQELHQRPGAMHSRFGDWNDDGLTDLMTLFAQEVESLFLLIQKADGSGFDAHEVLKKFPVWGFTSFEVADINADGNLDLIVANGDNGDWPNPPLKNYHGIRIYLWAGTDEAGLPRYEESFFQPMHGAFKVLARDFDGDGDLDLATIAQYADLEAEPMENFLYFENRSQPRSKTFDFRISSLPDLGNSTFTTMDTGDLDGDGDLDIVLGGRYLSRPNRSHSFKIPPFGLVYLMNP